MRDSHVYLQILNSSTDWPIVDKIANTMATAAQED